MIRIWSPLTSANASYKDRFKSLKIKNENGDHPKAADIGHMLPQPPFVQGVFKK
jgi:hypothetical protein